MARAAASSQPYQRSSSAASSGSGGGRPSSSRQNSSSSVMQGSGNAQSGGSGTAQQQSSDASPQTSPSDLIELSGPISLLLLKLVFEIIFRILTMPARCFIMLRWLMSGVESGAKRASANNSTNSNKSGNVEDLLRTASSDAEKNRGKRDKGNSNGSEGGDSPDGDVDEEDDYLSVPASPALTTLLDDALYRAYEAELVPTVSAASQLLTEFIQMKEASALVLRECRWTAGVPFSGRLSFYKVGDRNGSITEEFALGDAILNDVYLGGGALVNENGAPQGDMMTEAAFGPGGFSTRGATEAMLAEEISNWNEFDTVQDFAHQCYLAASEAIQKLTTDRLAESANITLQDSMAASSSSSSGASDAGGTGAGQANDASPTLPQSQGGGGQSSSSAPTALLSSLSFSSPADAGIGRCYSPQPRRDCWESPRLYCPDYYWADDAIGGCQRLLKTLSKHRFVSLISAQGWDRYFTSSNGGKGKSAASARSSSSSDGSHRSMTPPVYASCTPHLFPSLEAVHSLQYLVSELLPSTIPARLNQFRAAAEANAVVSKRLYLVKSEYRAPMRALWESYASLNAAPSVELVERYLRDYHGVKVAGEKAASDAGGDGSSKSLPLRRKGSTEVTKKTAIQQQREKLEKLITDKYWKHPAFIEALQLERYCERMEMEMSQMLLPLANLAAEIMSTWKGRIRAVAVLDTLEPDEEESKEEDYSPLTVALEWQDVPFMRELLRVSLSVGMTATILSMLCFALLTQHFIFSCDTEAEVNPPPQT